MRGTGSPRRARLREAACKRRAGDVSSTARHNSPRTDGATAQSTAAGGRNAGVHSGDAGVGTGGARESVKPALAESKGLRPSAGGKVRLQQRSYATAR